MGAPLGTTGSNSANEYRRVDNSFYKGTVIKNGEDHLLRCKIYIPEVTNQPLDSWLEAYKNTNIDMRFPGRNLSSGAWRDTAIWEKIAEFLPWAEPCTSLIGEHGPARYHSPTGQAVASESNYPEAWPATYSNTPTLRRGSFSPSYVYANTETNIGDAFTNTCPNLSMNNNPFGFNYGPKGYIDGPKGTFSQPRVGSQVWVFFFRGDHQFPVYFGGRQSAREIDPIYASAQGGPGETNPSSYLAGPFENELPNNVDPFEYWEEGYGREGSIDIDERGFVDQSQLRENIKNMVSGSNLNGYVPLDGARYGITQGTPDEWANYFTGLAGKESSYNIGTVGDIGRFRGNSNGLFQLSPDDATNYKFQSTPYTLQQLQDPLFNTQEAIKIHERLILQDQVIAQNGRGAARYWGPLRTGWTP